MNKGFAQIVSLALGGHFMDGSNASFWNVVFDVYSQFRMSKVISSHIIAVE